LQAVKEGVATVPSASEFVGMQPDMPVEEIGGEHEKKVVEEMQKLLRMMGTWVDIYLTGSGRKLADEERGCGGIKHMERTNSDLTLVDEESEDITCNKVIAAR
jgi:hypothetical protein